MDKQTDNDTRVEVLNDDGSPLVPRLSAFWWGAFAVMAVLAAYAAWNGGQLIATGGWLTCIVVWYLYGRLIQLYTVKSLMVEGMHAALSNVGQIIDRAVEAAQRSNETKEDSNVLH